MNVVSARRVQFRSSEQSDASETDHEDTRQLEGIYKKDLEVWKLLRRLSDTEAIKKLMEPKKKSSDCGPLPAVLIPTTVSIPEREGLRCMCYETLMQMIMDKAFLKTPQLFHSSAKPQKPALENLRPSWLRRALDGFYSNEHLQFPMATILVRWQMKRYPPNYDMAAVQSLLASFGTIRWIKRLGPNSCVVTFEDLAAACNVVQSRNIGLPKNRLFCAWWHKSMDNKNVTVGAKGVDIRTNHYKPVKSGW